MNKLVLFLLFSFSATIAFAQQSEIVYYYSSRKLDNEVSRDKAKFSETIIENDTVKTRTVRDLKKNEIISSYSEQGIEPVGVWVIMYGSGPRELDYNFKLVYSPETCTKGVLQKDDNFFDNDEVNGYDAPKLAGNYKTLGEFMSRNQVYTAKARREGIEGRVETTFTVTKEGVVENVVVNKGVHIVLDKEAVRLIRKMTFTTPPMVNGQAQGICVKLVVVFKLA